MRHKAFLMLAAALLVAGLAGAPHDHATPEAGHAGGLDAAGCHVGPTGYHCH